MTPKEKYVAKAKLAYRYAIERDTYQGAEANGNPNFKSFYAEKAAQFQSKLDELEKES